VNLLEPYHQTYTYNTGNNLTNLSHQAHSSAWQQTLTIYPNNNRGTELVALLGWLRYPIKAGNPFGFVLDC
jgi:hypothetical protein